MHVSEWVSDQSQQCTGDKKAPSPPRDLHYTNYARIAHTSTSERKSERVGWPSEAEVIEPATGEGERCPKATRERCRIWKTTHCATRTHR